MLKTTSGVYAIRNTKTNNLYIGCSKNVERRLKYHKRALLKGSHFNKHLQNSFNKHGLEAFSFYLVYETNCEEHVLLNLEKLFMMSETPETLYNIWNPPEFYSKSKNYKDFNEARVKAWKDTVESKGGLTPHSNERKKHQSNMVSGEKNGFFGRRHTEEVKKGISEKALKRWANPEERQRQSQRRKEFFQDPSNRAQVGLKSKGRVQSKEANQRKSQMYSGSGNPNAQPVTLNGVTYGSLKEASESTGLSKYKLKKLLKPNDYLERE